MSSSQNSAVAFAWYRQEQWPLLRAVSADGDQLESAYDEWHAFATQQVCVVEQNRFAARLAQLDPERYPVRLLHFEFDDEHWRWEWTATPQQRRRAFVSSWLADMKAEPAAPPNAAPPRR